MSDTLRRMRTIAGVPTRSSWASAWALSLALLVGLVPGTALAVSVDPSPSLTQARGIELVPLEGHAWRLATYRRRGVIRDAGPEVAAWIKLVAGKLAGSGGCNRIAGRYATVGDRIAMRANVKGKGSCAEQTMIVERSLRAGLRQAAAFTIGATGEDGATQLRVDDRTGREILRFELDDAGTLTTGEWQLESYSQSGLSVPAVAQPTAFVSFRSKQRNQVRRRFDGNLVGSTGCNGIVADYAQRASVLSLGELSVTDAPCGDALDAQQAAMLAVLDATSLSIELPPDRLVLRSQDSGEWLAFRNLPSLEGTTWLLDPLPAWGGATVDVTIRLEGGAVSGEGPCGSYSGHYETDGVLIRFSELSSTDEGNCDAAAQQRQLFDVLRQAVLVEKATPNLRLLDAFGAVLARFQYPGGP